jgi:hypothetical protein
MNYLKPTILALALTMVVSSTAFAGNIGGMRSTGNIGGTRIAGNIGGTRSARHSANPAIVSRQPSRFELESVIPAGFAGLIRLLLESGALL